MVKLRKLSSSTSRASKLQQEKSTKFIHNHSNFIMEQYLQSHCSGLYANQTETDVILILNDGFVFSHAVILQAVSPFFGKMLDSQGPFIQGMRKILMPDFTLPIISKVLQLIYSSQISLNSEEELHEVQSVLKFLEIHSNETLCVIQPSCNNNNNNSSNNDSIPVNKNGTIITLDLQNPVAGSSSNNNNNNNNNNNGTNSSSEQLNNEENVTASTTSKKINSVRKIAIRSSKRTINSLAPQPQPQSRTRKGKQQQLPASSSSSTNNNSNDNDSKSVSLPPNNNGESNNANDGKRQPKRKLKNIPNNNNNTKKKQKTVNTTNTNNNASKPSTSKEEKVSDDEEYSSYDEDAIEFKNSDWLLNKASKCQKCKKVYDSPALASTCLSRHKLLRCYFCFRLFRNTEQLFRHFSRAHKNTRENYLQCPFCETSVPFKSVSCHCISLHMMNNKEPVNKKTLTCTVPSSSSSTLLPQSSEPIPGPSRAITGIQNKTFDAENDTNDLSNPNPNYVDSDSD